MKRSIPLRLVRRHGRTVVALAATAVVAVGASIVTWQAANAATFDQHHPVKGFAIN